MVGLINNDLIYTFQNSLNTFVYRARSIISVIYTWFVTTIWLATRYCARIASVDFRGRSVKFGVKWTIQLFENRIGLKLKLKLNWIYRNPITNVFTPFRSFNRFFYSRPMFKAIISINVQFEWTLNKMLKTSVVI